MFSCRKGPNPTIDRRQCCLGVQTGQLQTSGLVKLEIRGSLQWTKTCYLPKNDIPVVLFVSFPSATSAIVLWAARGNFFGNSANIRASMRHITPNGPHAKQMIIRSIPFLQLFQLLVAYVWSNLTSAHNLQSWTQIMTIFVPVLY